MSPLLEVKNLKIKIASKTICETMNWQIKPHEIWGVLGQNGCGKTTFLLTLSGLLQPNSGNIFLLEYPLNQLKRKEIAKHLGILFQDTSFQSFHQTVYEYTRTGRYPHLKYFSIESTQDRLIIERSLADMNLDHLIHQSVETLSGGERRRLNIATLLTQSPLVYLLDEPMNHLDLHYQIKILDHFYHLAKTKSVAVIMTLHDIRIAQKYCDQIILFMNEGEFLLGTPEVILNKENLERVYRCTIDKDLLQI